MTVLPEPHPEGNPALAAAVQAILNRRLAASHGIADTTSRRAALLLEILPDASTALEVAAPVIAAAERERISRLIDETYGPTLAAQLKTTLLRDTLLREQS